MQTSGLPLDALSGFRIHPIQSTEGTGYRGDGYSRRLGYVGYGGSRQVVLSFMPSSAIWLPVAWLLQVPLPAALLCITGYIVMRHAEFVKALALLEVLKYLGLFIVVGAIFCAEVAKRCASAIMKYIEQFSTAKTLRDDDEVIARKST